VKLLAVALGAALFAGAAGGAQAATIRALPLPSGATIDTEAGGAAVTANAHGVVAASVQLASHGRIIVWDASNHATVLQPPPGGQYDDPRYASTQEAVVAPDGTVYGLGAYPFSGAYSGVRMRLYAWHDGVPVAISGTACAGGATDVHPTFAAPDGRLALAGSYDSDVMNIDAIENGGMPPTASVLEGAVCRVLDFGWISALDGGFAAGHRGYVNGKPFPPNANAQQQTYVAVRWTGAHAQEIGPGAALAVNARGDCAGADAPPGIHGTVGFVQSGPAGTVRREYSIGDMHALVWHGATMTRLSPTARRSIAYAINESGRTVVGTLFDDAGQHAMRWRDGKAQLLDSLLPHESGWQLLVAYAITPDGAIAGVGRHDGALAAFVMSAD
jgi:hypothetical protein